MLPARRFFLCYLCLMAADFSVIPGTKTEQYEGLITQIEAVVGSETDLIANMANISAMLKQQFGWHWVGFYLVRGKELVLGPFQGPVACTRIGSGKGVCGSAWEKGEAIVVDDINQFPGHIACSPFSRSEIVVPMIKDGVVCAVLDVDSEHLAYFDDTDKKYLEAICGFIPK